MRIDALLWANDNYRISRYGTRFWANCGCHISKRKLYLIGETLDTTNRSGGQEGM